MTATTERPGFADTFRRPATLGNWLRDRNPITLLVALVSLAVIAVAVPGVVVPVAVSVAFVVLAGFGGVGRAYSLTYLKLYAGVGVILFVLRALLIGGAHVLLTLGPLKVSTESVLNGLRFATVVMAVCGAITLFFALVPMKYLMLALELRGVTPRATYVMLASFQAIADLGRTARVVLDAQKARGIETEGNVVKRVRAFFPVLAPVFLSAMTSTEERAIALDARAFNARGPRTHLVSLRPMPGWEWLVVGTFACGAVVSCVGGVLGWF